MDSAELEAAGPCDRPVEFPMSDAIRSAVWPYCDSPAPEVVAGEKDACGVGFLAQLQGQASHWVLEQALRGLGCMEHRGGCGGDGDSGDGAGVLCEIPWSYLKAVWPEAAAARGLGMMFMPTDASRRAEVRGLCDEEAKALGLQPLGWRTVPVDPAVLGPLARATAAAPHGGGAFSGKDPTKVDRSAAYASRYLAKNIVAAGVSERCLIQLAYAIGVSKPLSIFVKLANGDESKTEKVKKIIEENFNLSPRGIREMLKLNNPIYEITSSYGHFGRKPTNKGEFTWEKTDKIDLFRL